MNLTNMIIKKSDKMVKSKKGSNLLMDYMENAEVTVCKINKIQ